MFISKLPSITTFSPTTEPLNINGSDIIVRALKQPSCSNVKAKDDVIDFDIEKELPSYILILS